MKYRQQKMLGAVRTKRMGRSSEAKAALRAKFIERARSYIGVVSSGAAAGGKWRSRVAEFPSYKFESTLYHSIQHHFRCLACRRRERGWWPVSRLP